MPAITREETNGFHSLFKKSYQYLDDNFHKFNETKKIQIAIAICKIAVPQKLEGEFNHRVIQMPAIQKEYSDEANLAPVNRIAEYDIGSLDSSENT